MTESQEYLYKQMTVGDYKRCKEDILYFAEHFMKIRLSDRMRDDLRRYQKVIDGGGDVAVHGTARSKEYRRRIVEGYINLDKFIKG